MRDLWIGVAVAVLLALATGLGHRATLPLHDQVARFVPSPELPVLVVEVTGDPAQAADAARRAGASSVWAALPAGHPMLGGARPDPERLQPGPDGRVRRYGGRALPLPEALDGLLRVGADQLAAAPDTLLQGKAVVLVQADPAIGVMQAAPGRPDPVDRGLLLAVGLGAEEAGLSLRGLPAGLGGLLSGGLALAWWVLLRRVQPGQALQIALVGGAVAVVAAVPARALMVQLPFPELAIALLVPALVRLGLSASDALVALDRVALRLRATEPEGAVASGLEALARMTRLYAPGFAVAAWRRGEGGPVLAARFGDESVLPTLQRLPAVADHSAAWRVEPVVEEGRVVGALAVAADGYLPREVAELVSTLAHSASGSRLTPPRPSADPFRARLEMARQAAEAALARAERWEALLGSTGVALGVFDLGGGLVAAGEPLQGRWVVDDPVPLVGVLRSLTGLEERLVRTLLRRAAAGGEVVRIPAEGEHEEVVVHPLQLEGRRSGFLVVVHDVRLHRRLDALKSDLLAASALQVRNAAAAIGGLAQVIAMSDDPGQRLQAAERVRGQVARIGAELDKAERLSSSRVGEQPIQPVFLQDCVRGVVEGLPEVERARVRLELPGVSSPVAARVGPLVEALDALVRDATRNGAACHIALVPDDEGMRLALQDDSGGLPASALADMLQQAGSAPGVARQVIEEMGGQLAAESLDGAGTRYTLRLRYF